MDNPDLVGKSSLNGYPPRMALYLQLEGEHVAKASFEAEGCGVTIACGSMLTQLVQGRRLADCGRIAVVDLSLALDALPPGKDYCACVAVAALQDALTKHL